MRDDFGANHMLLELIMTFYRGTLRWMIELG